MFDRVSDEFKKSMDVAYEYAASRESSALDSVHILVGCCRVQSSLASRVIAGCGASLDEIVARADELAVRTSSKSSAEQQPQFTDGAKRVAEIAMEEARGLGHATLGTHHILLGVLRVQDDAAKVLSESGVTLDIARKQCNIVHHEEIRLGRL